MYSKKQAKIENDSKTSNPKKVAYLYTKNEVISQNSAFSVAIVWVYELNILKVIIEKSWKLENEILTYPCENIEGAIALKNYLVAEKIQVFRQVEVEN